MAKKTIEGLDFPTLEKNISLFGITIQINSLINIFIPKLIKPFN